MRYFNLLNKLQSSLMVPFLISSLILALYEAFSLADIFFNGAFTVIFVNLSVALKSVVDISLCYFCVMMLTDGKRWAKAFLSIVFLICFKGAFSAISGLEISYIYALILGIFFSFCYNKFSKYVAVIINFTVALLTGFAAGYFTDFFCGALQNFASVISGKGLLTSVVFGVVNMLFSIFDSSLFCDLFFYNNYGGAVLINESLVTGVVDLFSSGYNGELISQLLSGKFFLLFSLVGLCFALGERLKGIQRNTLIILTLSAVLSGNVSILLLFILLENILFIFPLALLSAISYLSASLLNIGEGYLSGGGFIEMLINLNERWVYLVGGGVVLVALGYFTGKYFIEKRGISDCMNIYIPSRLNGFVKKLGGIENIIRIKDSKIEVRNPQLVNLIEGSCEIKGNIVEADKNLTDDLEEYFK